MAFAPEPTLVVAPVGAKPFLRWAGGKAWLLPIFNDIVKGRTFRRYHEPFLGGGSIFFGFDGFEEAVLSDLNDELIITYQCIRDNPRRVLTVLNEFDRTEVAYYALRSKKYKDPCYRAARFLYLNYHSYNGIYRVNAKGLYNVPFGRRNPIDYDTYDFDQISSKLSIADLRCCDFGDVRRSIRKNDLVYLDPPYTVSHNHNGFIEYNETIFRLADQYRLNELIEHIEAKGAYFILSNAAHEAIDEIFLKHGRRKLVLLRPNKIGGINAARGQTEEFLFTNIPVVR